MIQLFNCQYYLTLLFIIINICVQGYTANLDQRKELLPYLDKLSNANPSDCAELTRKLKNIHDMNFTFHDNTNVHYHRNIDRYNLCYCLNEINHYEISFSIALNALSANPMDINILQIYNCIAESSLHIYSNVKRFDHFTNSKSINRIENIEYINFLIRGLFYFHIVDVFSFGGKDHNFNFTLPLFSSSNDRHSPVNKTTHKSSRNKLTLILEIIKDRLTISSSIQLPFPLIYENLRVLLGIEYTGCTSLGFEPFLQYLFILYENYPMESKESSSSNTKKNYRKTSAIEDDNDDGSINISNINYSGCMALNFPPEINFENNNNNNNNKTTTTTTTTTNNNNNKNNSGNSNNDNDHNTYNKNNILKKYPISWPDQLPINIYYCHNHLPVFLENVQGLSDMLTYLRIPNKIVTKVTPHADNIYIVCFVCHTFINVPKYSILWNFEKNPRVQNILKNEPTGFICNSKGIYSTYYPKSYIQNKRFIWETAKFHIKGWEDSLQETFEKIVNNNSSTSSSSSSNYFWRERVHYIPPLLPLHNIRQSCTYSLTISSGTGNIDDSDAVNNDALFDLLRPIDILFFGNTKNCTHRQQQTEIFRQLGRQENITVEFFVDNDLYDEYRDTVVDAAKVVLNLGMNPTTTSCQTQSAPTSSASNTPAATPSASASATLKHTINAHRIRYLLSRGKVVLSEYSDIPEEHALFEGVVAFSCTDSLPAAALALLRDAALRREMHGRAAEFMAREQSVFSDSTALSLLTEALLAARDDIYPATSSVWRKSEAGRQSPSQSHRGNDDNDDDGSHPHSSKSSTKSLTSGGRASSPSFSEASPHSQEDSALHWAVHHYPVAGFAEAGAILYETLPRPISAVVKSVHPKLFTKVDLQLLVGYLSRRYTYQGVYVSIGFPTYNLTALATSFTTYIYLDPTTTTSTSSTTTTTTTTTTNAPAAAPHMTANMTSDQFFRKYEIDTKSLGCIDKENLIPTAGESAATTTGDACSVSISTTTTNSNIINNNSNSPEGPPPPPHHLFDLVVLLSKAPTTSATLLHDLQTSLEHLSEDGTILLQHCRPFYQPTGNADGEYREGAWQVVLELRKRRDVDFAIGDFDWGCGVLRKRANTYPLRDDIRIPFSQYCTDIDRIVPLLSLYELHEWLSDSEGTRKVLESYETASEYY